MKTPEIGDPVLFINDLPNTPIKDGMHGKVVNNKAGGYLIAMDDDLHLGALVAVGSIDWHRFIEVNAFYTVKPGDKFRVIKEPSHPHVRRLVSKGSIVSAVRRRDTRNPDVLDIKVEGGSDIGEPVSLIITPREFTEYLEPFATSQSMPVPAALRQWLVQIQPGLQQR